MNCSVIARGAAICDAHGAAIPMTTGSVVEFYIEPIFPHVGDIDVMYHWNDELAIPAEHLPPRYLASEFSNYVEVYEIIGSHLLGYVYLKRRYSLTKCTGQEKYNAVECDKLYLANTLCLETNPNHHIQGPAICYTPPIKALLSVELVFSVRCLVWPPQAADWPTRHRNYGWPESATLDRVVNNGCDVVHVAHRQCRQHKVMGELQWRLSFSRAEIVLINSWMPVQQIVYHMLRYFVKTERLTEC